MKPIQEQVQDRLNGRYDCSPFELRLCEALQATWADMASLVAERDILRERVDCHLNRLYELLQDTRDEVDAFNVICHRPKEG